MVVGVLVVLDHGPELDKNNFMLTLRSNSQDAVSFREIIDVLPHTIHYYCDAE